MPGNGESGSRSASPLKALKRFFRGTPAHPRAAPPAGTAGSSSQPADSPIMTEDVIEDARGHFAVAYPDTDSIGRFASKDVLAQYQQYEISYPVRGGLKLRGFLIPPKGDAKPTGTVVFNHGSIGLLPSNWPGIFQLSELGYLVFVPVRQGHNQNPGKYWEHRIEAEWGSEAMGPQLINALKEETQDAQDAVQWLLTQPEVDASRIAFLGSSYGGVIALFQAVGLASGEPAPAAASKPSGIPRAVVSFAGPSMTWADTPALQTVLLEVMQKVEVPVFLIQAQNDSTLAPTYVLAGELAKLGKVHEVRIYPPVGTMKVHGHGVFGRAPQLWAADVKAFLERHGLDAVAEAQ